MQIVRGCFVCVCTGERGRLDEDDNNDGGNEMRFAKKKVVVNRQLDAWK